MRGSLFLSGINGGFWWTVLCVCELYVYVVFQVRLRHRNSQGLLATESEKNEKISVREREWKRESKRERSFCLGHPQPKQTALCLRWHHLVSFQYVKCMRVDEVTCGDSASKCPCCQSTEAASEWYIRDIIREHIPLLQQRHIHWCGVSDHNLLSGGL